MICMVEKRKRRTLSVGNSIAVYPYKIDEFVQNKRKNMIYGGVPMSEILYLKPEKNGRTLLKTL